MKLLISRIFIIFITILYNHVSFAENIGFYNLTKKILQEKLGNNEIELDIHFASKAKYQDILSKQNDISSINIISISGSSFKLAIQYINYPHDEILGRFNSFLNIPIANKYLKSGTKISNNDIILSRKSLAQLPQDIITNQEHIIGMQTKRNIQPNTLIKDSDIIKPQLINKNEVINVKYNTDKIALKTTAIAMSSGGLSDIIKLKNEDTGVIITGQVIDSKTVKIGY